MPRKSPRTPCSRRSSTFSAFAATPASARGWCGITTNEAITRLRRRRVRRTASLDTAYGSRDGDGSSTTLHHRLSDSREPSPEQRVQQQETHQQIQAALEQVDADFRTVLVLRDIDQMDYQQIAEVLEVPIGTVKSRLFRARLARARCSAKLKTVTAGKAGEPGKAVKTGKAAAIAPRLPQNRKPMAGSHASNPLRFMDMTSRYDQDLLLGYLEGELTDAECAEFERRLAEDDQLRRLLDKLQADREAMRSLPLEQPPAELLDDVTHQLERQMLLEEPEGEGAGSSRSADLPVGRIPWSKVAAYGSLAAAVLICGGVIIASLTETGIYQQTAMLNQPVASTQGGDRQHEASRAADAEADQADEGEESSTLALKGGSSSAVSAARPAQKSASADESTGPVDQSGATDARASRSFSKAGAGEAFEPAARPMRSKSAAMGLALKTAPEATLQLVPPATYIKVATADANQTRADLTRWAISNNAYIVSVTDAPARLAAAGENPAQPQKANHAGNKLGDEKFANNQQNGGASGGGDGGGERSAGDGRDGQQRFDELAQAPRQPEPRQLTKQLAQAGQARAGERAGAATQHAARRQQVVLRMQAAQVGDLMRAPEQQCAASAGGGASATSADASGCEEFHSSRPRTRPRTHPALATGQGQGPSRRRNPRQAEQRQAANKG